jgi:hypothetical protein
MRDYQKLAQGKMLDKTADKRTESTAASKTSSI